MQEKKPPKERGKSFRLSIILGILNLRLMVVLVNGLLHIPKGHRTGPETAAQVLQRLQIRALDSLPPVVVPEIRIKEARHQRNQRGDEDNRHQQEWKHHSERESCHRRASTGYSDEVHWIVIEIIITHKVSLKYFKGANGSEKYRSPGS